MSASVTGAVYARVVFDLAVADIDRPLDYRVPPGWAGRLRPGQRVRVPLGGRQVEALVVALSGETEAPDPRRVRDVSALVDPEPIVDRDRMELAQWIAARYLCEVAEAYRLVMPPGARRAPRHRAALTSAAAAMVEAGAAEMLTAGRSQVEQLVLAALREGPRDVAELQRELTSELAPAAPGAANARARAIRIALEQLRRIGLVSLQTEFRDGVGKKERFAVELAMEPRAAVALADELRRRAPRQAELLERLARSPEPLVVSGVQAPAAPAAAVALERRGAVRRVRVGIRRAPLAGLGAELAAAAGDGAKRPPPLTPAQAEAVAAIEARLARPQPGAVLLHGVTGSGKTEVYLRAIGRVLEQGGRAIVLVPEISLTPQMIGRFEARFPGRIAVAHSRLGPGERFDEWERIRSGDATVVIGARSAVFAPLQRLRLIVLDEEHETSYKQEESPRYHARDVGAELARRQGALLLLGSATPSLETFHAAQAGEIGLIELPERVEGRSLPRPELVDLRGELAAGHRGVISRALQQRFAATLGAGGQAILFLNRRGYASFVLCRSCGYTARCPDCDVSLTAHQAAGAAGEPGLLLCHYCGHAEPAPSVCPVCGSRYIRHFGSGTQRVADELRLLFPSARVQRLDVDTTREKGSLERTLGAFGRRELDVLVGTQMVAKGLDFPGVTLVGVIAADTSLNFPDFRAAERTFQLLTQVAGRSGRGEDPGQVVIQTYNPDHYAVRLALRADYAGFFEREVSVRRELGYPPFARLIKWIVWGPDGQAVVEGAQRLANLLRGCGDPMAVLGPAPAPIPRLRGQVRWQVVLRGGREAVHEQALAGREAWARSKPPPGLRLSIDIDPQSML